MVNVYHVHVYKVIKKMEVTTLAPDSIKAKELALEAAKEGKLKEVETDTEFIAMDFKVEKKEDE